jgi:hypothetical protein
LRLLTVLIIVISALAIYYFLGPGSPDGSALAKAVAQLEDAQSYSFDVSGNHKWSFEGEEQNWDFNGQGSAVKGGEFTSQINAPADVYLSVVIDGTDVKCEDTRGPVGPPSCDSTFGGVRRGASPYTAIAYLRHSTQLGDAKTVTLNGKDSLLISFDTKMEAVASLDEAHSQIVSQITFRKGEVWIDKVTNMPLKENVVIRYAPEVGETETIEVTLNFR